MLSEMCINSSYIDFGLAGESVAVAVLGNGGAESLNNGNRLLGSVALLANGGHQLLVGLSNPVLSSAHY